METRIPAVIFDRDGTLAQIDRTMVEHRRDNERCPLNQPAVWTQDTTLDAHAMVNKHCRCKDWTSFNAAIPFDNPVPHVIAMTQSIRPDWAVLISTGRSEDFRWPMQQWLNKHEARWDYMFMRGSKDNRRDDAVKLDLYRTQIEPVFDVKYVVDDRPIVCDMWRTLGLPLVQVEQPDGLPFMGLG